MTFSPTIPASTDLISVSQGDIQTNFSQLNTIFQVDHVEYNNATVANRGKHKALTMLASAAPTPIAGEASLYVFNSGGTREQLRYRRESSGTIYPITEKYGAIVRFNGATGAIIGTAFNVTSVTRTGAGLYTIKYAANMTDTNYAVIASVQDNTGNLTKAIIKNTNAATCVIHTSNNAGAPADVESVHVFVMGEILT